MRRRSVDRPTATARPRLRNDTLRGTPAADVLQGKGGHDKLYGLAGNDRLVGGVGKDLGEALLGGDRAGAAAAVEEATGFYELKGNLLAADRARGQLERLAAR